jgi:hypothetical protein
MLGRRSIKRQYLRRRPAAAPSCSARHSCALRAPTPVGSKCCSVRSAICRSSARFRALGQSVSASSSSGWSQVAVVVERLDQELDQRAVALGKLRQAQLPGQVLAQRGARGLHVLVIAVVVVKVRCDVAGTTLPASPAASSRHRRSAAFFRRFGPVPACRRLVPAPCSRASAPPFHAGRQDPAASSSRSSSGFSSRYFSSSCFSSSVDSCNNRIDCCNCGVSARCWEA